MKEVAEQLGWTLGTSGLQVDFWRDKEYPAQYIHVDAVAQLDAIPLSDIPLLLAQNGPSKLIFITLLRQRYGIGCVNQITGVNCKTMAIPYLTKRLELGI